MATLRVTSDIEIDLRVDKAHIDTFVERILTDLAVSGHAILTDSNEVFWIPASAVITLDGIRITPKDGRTLSDDGNLRIVQLNTVYGQSE